MITEEEITRVGKLLKTHALKGEMNVLLDIDPEFLTEGNPAIIDIDGIYVPFYADSVRPKGSTSYLVKFQGIDSEIEAREMVNKNVYALRNSLKDFMHEEYEDECYTLYDDMIGWELIDTEKGLIGKIKEIDTNTENELLIVETPEGNTVYVPLADDLITEIDEDGSRLVMELPEGLLELN